MTSPSSPRTPAHTLVQARAAGARPTTPGEPATRVLHTPLLAREPGADDYELARTLLDRQFPHGHTAQALLAQYRERDLDLSVSTVLTPRGAATRLVITTGYTPLTTTGKQSDHDPRTAPEPAGNR